MIARYSPKDISEIWSLERKYRYWLDVEIAVCKALQKYGYIPDGVAEEISKAKILPQRIAEIESRTNHDVIAFIESVQEQVGELGRYMHFGLTSSDVIDTALSLAIRDSIRIIEEDIKKLMEILKDLALRYKDVAIMGRTHGVFAEPTILGLRFLLWYEEFNRHLDRLQSAKERILVCKISGAVGTFSQIPPEIEEETARILGLNYDKISTQIIQRDRHAEYLSLLAIIGGTLSKMAIDVRHLHRSEIKEMEEPFLDKQKGSSAMPHKKNPIICERITGLSRVLRANAVIGFENMELWHERDISHSSAERIALPDSSILVVYMLRKMQFIMRHLVVHKDNIKRNINMANELFFSQSLLLYLVNKGVSRIKAYELVQRNALSSYKNNKKLSEIIQKDKEIMQYLSQEDIKKIFDINNFFRNIDKLYVRILGDN